MKNSILQLIFTILTILNSETQWKHLAKKNAIFLQLESFVNKTTFYFHSFNKINDFVIT